MGSLRLLVIIVNYRTGQYVCQCLDSILPQIDPRQDKVIVVDNDSQDDSCPIIEKYIQRLDDKAPLLLAEKENGGFAAGNNRALQYILATTQQYPDFVLLLNPDTQVLHHGISVLLDFMQEHPHVGIAGSRIEQQDGQPQCSCFHFHSISSEILSALRIGWLNRRLAHKNVVIGVPSQSQQVDWVAGAAMLVRGQVFADIGLMDKNYFLYFEETDFCLAARQAGWPCWYVPASRVIHYVGKSTGIVSGNNRKRPSYWFKARQYYFLKNHGVIYTILTDISWGIAFAIWRVRRRLQRLPDRDPQDMLSDFCRHSYLARYWYKKQ